MNSLMRAGSTVNSLGAAINSGSTLEVNVYPRGLPGYVYTPSIDDFGNISWTNKGGLVNPEQKNIRGIHFTPSIDKNTGVLSWESSNGNIAIAPASEAVIYTYVPVIDNEGVLNWELRQGGISDAEVTTEAVPSNGVSLREAYKLKFSELTAEEKEQIRGDKGEKGENFSIIGVYNSSEALLADPIAQSAPVGSWALIQGMLSTENLSPEDKQDILRYVDQIVAQEVTNKLNETY